MSERELPEPIGYVTMQTPRGAPDGIWWTGRAFAHDSPLFSLQQMEEALGRWPETGVHCAYTGGVCHRRGCVSECHATRLVDEKTCKHDRTQPHWDHIKCLDCAAIHTGSVDGWGIAAHQWFVSAEVARFYKSHGHMPEPTTPQRDFR